MKDDFDIYLENQMKDSEFASEYNNLEPEYVLRDIIYEARQKCNLTQKDLADRCGIKPSNLSRLESGTANPTIKTLQQIAKGLNRKLEIRFL